MSTDRILLASPSIAPFSFAQESAYMQAALAENAFARINYEALFGDGSNANYDTKLTTVMTPAAYEAMCARLAAAGIRVRPTTYGQALSSAVYFSGGQPMIDQPLLLSLGILSPRCTAKQLHDVLRFDEAGPGLRRERSTIANAAFAAETVRTPRARPLGWTTLGAKVPTTGMPANPMKSGWYLRTRLAWPDKKLLPRVGSHSSFGYYNADSKRWEMTSSLDYEYDPDFIPTPGVGSEMLVDSAIHTLDFYPVTMGPAAKAQGLTEAQFQRAMLHDVVAFEAHYRTLSKVGWPQRQIFYHFVPSMSPHRIDGNCNTYASYLMASLGVAEAYPRGGGWTGTTGNEVIGRDPAGDVYIYGSGSAARAGKLIGTTAKPFSLSRAFTR